MAEKGMDQRTLQEIMGHQNLALTMKVYNHVDEKRMRDEMDKLDAVRNVSKDIENDNNGNVFKVSLFLKFLHRIVQRTQPNFTQLLHRTTEKIQNHLKTYHFQISNPTSSNCPKQGHLKTFNKF